MRVVEGPLGCQEQTSPDRSRGLCPRGDTRGVQAASGWPFFWPGLVALASYYHVEVEAPAGMVEPVVGVEIAKDPGPLEEDHDESGPGTYDGKLIWHGARFFSAAGRISALGPNATSAPARPGIQRSGSKQGYGHQQR